jgi:GPI mannosyltransferase 3
MSERAPIALRPLGAIASRSRSRTPSSFLTLRRDPRAPLLTRRSLPFPERAAIAALLLTALLLRLIPVLFVPSLNWPDEVFQASEQAHRLVYGTGLVPWEFQFGARSWLLPGAIAALMEFARLFGDGPRTYLPVIAAAFAALGTAPVLCSFLWARRFYGVAGGFVAGAAVAVAPELVYFGARTLSEVVAGNLLVVAFYLWEPGDPAASRRRLFAAGALFALIFALRLQLAPVFLVVGLWIVWQKRRESLPPLLAGAGFVLVLIGVLDTLTLGYPFASLWRYALYNAYDAVSSTFSVEPWDFYFLGEFGVWGAAIAVPLLLAGLGARRTPLLAVSAIVILLAHSAIPHKEYRFIYPAILLVAVLTGIGLARCARRGCEALQEHRWRPTFAPLLAASVAILLWLPLAGKVSFGGTLTALRFRNHDRLEAALFVANGPNPCGIGVYGPGKHEWVSSGGYTYLQKPVPLYWPQDEAALLADAPAFDTLIYRHPPPPSLDFRRAACFGRVCVARRPGGCRNMAMRALPIPRPLRSVAQTEAAARQAIGRSPLSSESRRN